MPLVNATTSIAAMGLRMEPGPGAGAVAGVWIDYRRVLAVVGSPDYHTVAVDLD